MAPIVSGFARLVSSLANLAESVHDGPHELGQMRRVGEYEEGDVRQVQPVGRERGRVPDHHRRRLGVGADADVEEAGSRSTFPIVWLWIT